MVKLEKYDHLRLLYHFTVPLTTDIFKFVNSFLSNVHLSRRGRDLKSCHFLLKSDFQVITFFIILEVGYLVIIVLNFVYK